MSLGIAAAGRSPIDTPRRLRWARYFKPIVLTEGGFIQNTFNRRQRIDQQNNLIRALPNQQQLDWQLGVGVGYHWEINLVDISIGLKYVYHSGFNDFFAAPFFVLAVDV